LCAGIASAGCTGQSVEGAWKGGLPLDGADSCVIKLQADTTFSAKCASAGIQMAGIYARRGDTLLIESRAYTYRNHPATSRPAFEFKLEGHGNQITLLKDRERWTWTRLDRSN
jgi:hypothetical protein